MYFSVSLSPLCVFLFLISVSIHFRVILFQSLSASLSFLIRFFLLCLSKCCSFGLNLFTFLKFAVSLLKAFKISLCSHQTFLQCFFLHQHQMCLFTTAYAWRTTTNWSQNLQIFYSIDFIKCLPVVFWPNGQDDFCVLRSRSPESRKLIVVCFRWLWKCSHGCHLDGEKNKIDSTHSQLSKS